jgi:hypothetical protein
LKTRQNAVASFACRLPPETLSKIFLALRDDLEDDREWIKATHVCRHWRRVAQDCVALWTHLPILNPAFTEAILPFTKNAQISVHLDGVTIKYKEVLQEILSHPGRLGSIGLVRNSNECALGEAFSKWTKAAPLLKEILERVELSYCSLPWSQIPFTPNLVSLLLETDIDLYRPTASQFLQTIGSLPYLRLLSLSGFLPPDN